MKHLLDLASLSKAQIITILKLAAQFYQNKTDRKISTLLAGKTVVNLFYENSTRTRTSFEIAAKSLGANVINFSVETSSIKKGESLLDTIDNLSAMSVDLLVLRHPTAGAAEFLATYSKTEVAIINAGDGCHEHPSQGLLDLLAIEHYKKDFHKLKVAIVGDVLHSRVARSLMIGLKKLGTKQISLVGPKTLVPPQFAEAGVELCYDLATGIKNADVIVMLRLQKERMTSVFLPSEQEYRLLYSINQDNLRYAKPDVLVMHPGPINRGVEVDSEVAEGPHSIILQQVSFGVATRMAIMTLLLNPTAQLT